MKALLNASLLAVLVLAAACEPGEPPPAGGGPEKAEEEVTPERRARVVRTTHPTRRSMHRVIEVTGEVVALRSSEVAARVGGIPVVSLEADVGDQVKAGEILLELDRADLEQKLQEAVAARKEAETRVQEARLAVRELEAEKRAHKTTIKQKRRVLDRMLKQEERGAVSGEDVENAQFEYDKELGHAERLELQIEKARVTFELAELAVEAASLAEARARREEGYATVRAPFDGIVATRTCDVGTVAAVAQPLFEMFDPASMVVHTHVPQRDLRDLQAGQRAVITSEASPGSEVQARVSLISPVVDEELGTVMIRLVPEDRSWMKPGLFVSGHIILETRPDTLVVPRKAVAYERERPYVYVVDHPDGEGAPRRARRLYFREGLSTGEMVEVRPEADGAGSPLSVSDEIVLVGLDRLRDGDPVKLQREVLEQEPSEGTR